MDKPQTTLRLNPLLAALVIAVAFWPVLHWYVCRMNDRSDEPWGLVALAAALFFVRRPVRRQRSDKMICVALVAAAVYFATFAACPDILKAILAIVIVWFAGLYSMSMPSRAGIFCLFILSLPVVPSLNFFAGYPMRLAIASGATEMLSWLGLPAVQDGTFISIAGKPVCIDAPCSGINMLWCDCFVAAVAACVFRLSNRSMAILLACVTAFILCGNILRAAMLVIFDQIASPRLAAFEPGVHVAVGLLSFVLIAGATMLTARFVRDRLSSQTEAIDRMKDDSTGNNWRFYRYALTSICLLSVSAPFVDALSGQRISACMAGTPRMQEPKWPTTINGQAITAVASLDEEKAFARDFPGWMKRFTDGESAYFVRVVARQTRQLHPSSDCFKGMGYDIEPEPLVVANDLSRWGSFNASKNGRQLKVLERIYDSHGNSWTDVSAWYWAACLNKTSGPWWDVTIARPVR